MGQTNPLHTSALHQTRKLELLKKCALILTDLPIEAKGNLSLAQEISNRCESITKNPSEYQWLIDAITYLIEQSKGKEIEVVYKGKVQSRESLAKNFGIFLAPSKKRKKP